MKITDYGALVAAGLAAIGAAVTYGTLSANAASSTARLEKLEPQAQQNSTDVAVLKQAVGDVKESLDRIERALGTKK